MPAIFIQKGETTMGKRTISLLSVLIVSIMVLSSCAFEKTQRKDTLYVGSKMHNGLYNPLYAVTSYDKDVCNLIYEGLVVESPDGFNLVNERLVESLDVSEDGLDFTFTIRDGVKFSDGKPLTAEDVVFTYQTLADPSSTATRHGYIAVLKGGSEYMKGDTQKFEAVEALDENRVVFHFMNPLRDNLQICSIKIIAKHHFPNIKNGNVDIELHNQMQDPLGSGPYKLKQFNQGKNVVLEKNNNYWDKDNTDYRIKYIDIKFLKNKELMGALEKGEVDLLPEVVDVSTFEKIEKWQNYLENSPELDFTIFQRNAYGFLGFNTRAGFSSDIAVRQALAYGFDTKGFVDKYFGEMGDAVHAQLPASSDIYHAMEDQLNDYDYSIEKAEQILKDAGYENQDGVLYKQDEKVILKFLVTEDNVTVHQILDELEETCTILGIELKAIEMPFSDILSTISSENDDWNIFFTVDQWMSDDPVELTRYFSSEYIPSYNVTRYSNPKVDEILKAGNTELDIYSSGTRSKYIEVLLQLNNDLPELPIYTNKVIAIKDKRLKNIEFGTYKKWSLALNGAYLED